MMTRILLWLGLIDDNTALDLSFLEGCNTGAAEQFLADEAASAELVTRVVHLFATDPDSPAAKAITLGCMLRDLGHLPHDPTQFLDVIAELVCPHTDDDVLPIVEDDGIPSTLACPGDTIDWDEKFS